MTNTNMPATKWLASACRSSALLIADGPIQRQRHESALYALAAGFGGGSAVAVAQVPTQPTTKGGLRGSHPWRDEPVIT